MTHVLEMGLAPQELLGIAEKAKESLNQPGVAVDIPKSMVVRIEAALQSVLSEQLFSLREQARSVGPEVLELRIR